MHMRMAQTLTLCLLVVAAAGVASAQHGAHGPACDRNCLTDLVEAYLDAVVAGDPAAVPIAEGAAFVENTIPLIPGEGLWQTASEAPTTFKIYVPDPVAGQVGFLGLMREDGNPVLLALRLAVRDGRITEMEHLLARNINENGLRNLQTPRPGLLTTLPPEERMTREDLLAIGASYYDALVESDGSLSPFAHECVRRENGMQTTGNPPPAQPGFGTFGALGCAAQLDTRIMSYITSIDNRRVEIADVETGLVFGLSHFRHPMESKELRIVGVAGIETWEMNFDPFDLPAAHIYKVRAGKIYEIEAMGFTMPYDSPSGWE